MNTTKNQPKKTTLSEILDKFGTKFDLKKQTTPISTMSSRSEEMINAFKLREPKTSKYDVMRNELEKTLTSENSELKNIELSVYDEIVRIRTEFDNNISENKKSYSLAKQNAKTIKEIAYSTSVGQHISDYRIEELLKSSLELESSLNKIHPVNDKAPAYIIVIGYKGTEEEKSFLYDGQWYDKKIPLLKKKGIFSKDKIKNDEAISELEEMALKDKSIIIDEKGNLVAKRVLLKNTDPTVHQNYIKSAFKKIINARHEYATSASFDMPENIVIYTLSEETGDIRRMSKGITHSTVHGEGKKYN